MKHISFFLICLCIAFACGAQSIGPVGAVPSPSQLKWHEMEYYMFIHFGPNTFTNKEWGHGDEDPKVFNPSQLNCDQWVTIAKRAGMKGIIITAKHHDGFCLWPSKFSAHTVRESAWKNGQGDVLKELSEACKKEGLKFGVYLSPWDRNHPDYGTEKYNQTFVSMLREVLGNYGEVFEQWFDGANGEGPNGKKQVYDWKLFNSTVLEYQPSAIIFSDGGPGCRWVGNEDGFAGETNWCTLDGSKVYPGYPNYKELTTGLEGGGDWIPAECDVSIRPGWFYSPETDGKVKGVKKLAEIYLGSVGRGGNLLLNVPVDRRGLIAKEDSSRLMEFRSWRDQSFGRNLTAGAKITGAARKGYGAGNLNDQKSSTSWSPADGQPGQITIQFPKETNFSCVVLQETISLGQRIRSFLIEVEDKNGFKEVARQTTVGHKRIILFPRTTSKQIRITILESRATPTLSEIGVYSTID